MPHVIKDYYKFSVPVISWEADQVVKIPVQGPAPYNKLIVLTHDIFNFKLPFVSKISRGVFEERTSYRLNPESFKMPPKCVSSVFATFKNIHLWDDATFLFAIDSVEGFFDDAGYYCIRYTLACSCDLDSVASNWSENTSIRTTSYFLVIENG